ncbi:MAG: hypothetical protein AB7S38_35040 [Vulcanimicrobiota bacterium]
MSLLEAIFAMFYLSSAILVIAHLLDAGLQAGLKVEQQLTATAIARNELSKLRAEAVTRQGFDALANYDGTPRSSGEPGFSVSIITEPFHQYSPCSAVELAYPADQRRELTSSTRKVRVRVSWGNTQGSKVQLVSLIAAPPPEVESLQLKGVTVPNPINPDELADFTVQAEDSDGKPVPDLFYEWSVVPGSGNGTVIPSRDGRTCQFVHRYRIPPSTDLYFSLGSSCGVEAATTSGGRLVTDSMEVFLAKP